MPTKLRHSANTCGKAFFRPFIDRPSNTARRKWQVRKLSRPPVRHVVWRVINRTRTYRIYVIRKILKRLRNTLARVKDAQTDSGTRVLLSDKTTQTSSGNTNIPRVIFQTGPSRSVSPEHFSAIEKLKRINSSFEYFFFDDKAMWDYMEARWAGQPILDVFERVSFPQMRADIFRYCLIFDRGGFYVDFNKSISKPLLPYLGENPGAVLSMDPTVAQLPPPIDLLDELPFPHYLFAQFAFGFQPQHDILREMISSICKSAASFQQLVFESPRDAIFSFTGPGAFTRVIWDYLARQGSSHDVIIAGIAFDESTSFRLPNSRLHDASRPHYSQVKNSIILR